MSKTTRRSYPRNFRSNYRSKSRFKPWMGWSIGLGLLIAIVVVIFMSRGQSIVSSINGVVTYGNLARDHVAGPVTYPLTPPVGGSHNAILQNCGIYDKPVANENAVHSLEHGAVWLTYKPDLPAEKVEQLRNLARGYRSVLLAPYLGLSVNVVASAWGVQLKLDSPTDPRLSEFITKYERGPQTPEPGALCSGGQGSPLER